MEIIMKNVLITTLAALTSFNVFADIQVSNTKADSDDMEDFVDSAKFVYAFRNNTNGTVQIRHNSNNISTINAKNTSYGTHEDGMDINSVYYSSGSSKPVKCDVQQIKEQEQSTSSPSVTFVVVLAHENNSCIAVVDQETL